MSPKIGNVACTDPVIEDLRIRSPEVTLIPYISAAYDAFVVTRFLVTIVSSNGR